MQPIHWYIKRLRQMSARELAYRAHTYATGTLLKFRLFSDWSPAQPEIITGPNFSLPAPSSINSKAYIDAANLILGGYLSIFSLKNVHIGEIPNWNQDPKTGRIAPLRFGKSLDYRNEHLVGDIKYLWEINRHLQLTTLGQAYSISGQERYGEGIISFLTGWLDQCPYLRGPNWTSSLELAIRLINWSLTWRLIGGIDSKLFNSQHGKSLLNRWLSSIHQHLHFISGNLSRYSSANNHLIGEASGLFIGACIWPYWKESATWRALGYKILCNEMLIQNTEDGVNKEQALSYQQFVLDFFLISALTGEKAGIEFPRIFWDRFEAMLGFIASIMDSEGNTPMIGDADDGFVTRLSQNDKFCPYQSLLATGAVLFNRPDFKQKSQSLDDKTSWLLGEERAGVFHTMTNNPDTALPICRTFPQGGYYVLGDNFESPNEVRLVVDSGPLGYLSIAAHGHSDALSIMLSIAGHEFLIDPGTYAYHTQKHWRDYFRGTSAHNTIRIDGTNQSEIGGNFMWLHRANAWCEHWESDIHHDFFCGSHDGYSTLDDPVIHQRSIELLKNENKILVIDTLTCQKKHVAETFWHFSECCHVELINNRIIAVNDNIKLIIKPEYTLENVTLLYGDELHPAGWISKSFDTKQPTATAVLVTEIDKTICLRTEITWHIT